MSKKINIKKASLLTTLSFALLLSACGNDSSANSKTKLGGKDIEIPYTMDGAAPRTLVLAEVLEDAGYNVIATPVEASGTMYANVADNKDAMHTSGRLPSTDESYLKKYGKDITVYDNEKLLDNISNSSALAVPKYMDVDSIDDLKNDKQLGKSVDYTILGTDPRNGIMKNTEDGLEDNKDLDKWKLKETSDQEMIKTLGEKFKKQEPVIVTASQPHWMFEQLQLKTLKDPDKIYGKEKEHIDLVFNKEFKKEHPGAYKIATRMAKDWNRSDEEKLMKRMFIDKENQQKVAEDYVDDNENTTDKWRENVGK